MTKKKNDIPDDLIGFKDFIDTQEKRILKKQSRDPNSNFELLTFLERESIRLSKTIELCESKTYLLKKYPQDTNIIVNQETDLIEQRVGLIHDLKKEDSPLTLNLSELLQSHFNY